MTRRWRRYEWVWTPDGHRGRVVGFNADGTVLVDRDLAGADKHFDRMRRYDPSTLRKDKP